MITKNENYKHMVERRELMDMLSKMQKKSINRHESLLKAIKYKFPQQKLEEKI